MREKLLVGLTAGFAMIALWCGSVFATTLTMQDFESGTSAIISGGTRTITGGYANYGFGNYFQWSGGNAITLNLSGIDPHTTLDLEFDLAVIDSWDGNGSYGPDYFNVTLDNDTIFKETFSNFSYKPQSYDGTPLTIGSNIYYSHWNDSAYNISLTGLTHSSPTVAISWFATGGGWQGGSDESFAVDNIKVSSSPNSAPVPEPASILLLGMGLIGLAGTRIKRKK